MVEKFSVTTILKILVLVSIVIIMGYIASQGLKQTEVNFDDLNDQVINILNSEPHTANETNSNYIFYIPSEYEYAMDENVVIMENYSGAFTLYTGYNTKVDKDFLNSLNINKTKVFEYVEENEEDIYYFYVWENDAQTYNIFMGVNDIYIEGIVKKDKVERYIIDMATILNSVQQINNKEEIDVNGGNNGN